MPTTAAYLEIKDPKGDKQIPLDSGPLTIGRNFTNLLVIEEPMASRFHCVIDRAAEGYSVRDLDSRNGTLLNGKPLRGESPMSAGDIVKIGKTELKLIVPAARSGPGIPSKAADTAMAELADLVSDKDEADEEEEATTSQPVNAANEFERQLRERADLLADRTFTDRQIALINARANWFIRLTSRKTLANRSPCSASSCFSASAAGRRIFTSSRRWTMFTSASALTERWLMPSGSAKRSA